MSTVKIWEIVDDEYVALLACNITDGYYDTLNCRELFDECDWLPDYHRQLFWVEHINADPEDPSIVHPTKLCGSTLIVIEQDKEDSTGCKWFIFDGSGWACNKEGTFPSDMHLKVKGEWTNLRYLHGISATGFDDANFLNEITTAFSDLDYVIKAKYFNQGTIHQLKDTKVRSVSFAK